MRAHLIALFLFLKCSLADDCVTPNGEKAKCIPILSCPVILNSMFTFEQSNFEFAKKSRCGHMTEPLVCCGSFGNDQSTTITTGSPIKENILIPDKRYCGYQHYDDYFHPENSTSSSSIDEFPWLVSLKYRDRDGEDAGFICAGSLITNQHVLTTAHCVTSLQFKLISVRLGEYNIESDEDCIKNEQFNECTDPVIDAGFSEIILHPFYKRRIKMFDIALVKLNISVEYSEYIRPICLPFPGTKLAKYGDLLVQSGWGQKNSQSIETDVKKKIFTELLPNEECAKVFKGTNITESLTCTREPQGTDIVSCKGDSGAPVMFANRNQWHQEGIIAYGKSCGTNVPSVNINVVHYLDWIVDNIK